jgi:hypothetical protein
MILKIEATRRIQSLVEFAKMSIANDTKLNNSCSNEG